MPNIPGLPINAFMLAVSVAIIILLIACPIWNRWRSRGMSARNARRIRFGILAARYHMITGVYVHPQSELGRAAYRFTVWRRFAKAHQPKGLSS